MKKIFLFLFIVSYLLLPIPTNQINAQGGGATLFLSPASGTYAVNRSFTVKIMVNSGGGIGINAAEGNISYDPTFLTITNISEADSIFKLWTTNPTYSNTDGRITFGGGSPGAYTGNAGPIFSVTFSAKKAGEAQVNFTSGIVLAADGKGTNVFSGFGNGKYTIEAAETKTEEPKKEPEEEPEESKPKGILPPIPEVSSKTHPDEDTWYSNNEPEFTWKILSDLTGVAYSITDGPTSDPGLHSEGIIESEKFEQQEDGVLYFHIKYQNRYGWGQLTHRKFLVDVTPPEPFKVVVDNDGDPTNPTPKLLFKTEDKTSGLAYYDIVTKTESIKAELDQVSNGYYVLSPLGPGEHNISVAAYDNANNSASSSIKFIVEPLKSPVITDIPKVINKNEELIIRGSSFYPNITLMLYIAKVGQDPLVLTLKTDSDGNWSYFHQGELEKGNYEVWAKLIDDRGAQSLDSTRHLMTVVSPSILEQYCVLFNLLLLIIVILLASFILYQHKKFTEERIRIKRETEEVKDKLRKIFAALREEVDELIELADKKPGLSESEKRIKEKIQESLDISEEFISKEVEDVEKEIKIKDKRKE
ncbi:cohesin domain-containing protein [Patescibacteria group bacterium]